jgi:hypothetical protein
MSSTTLDQKKTVQQGEESIGTSPNNIKKPDAAGFGKQFIVTVIQMLFYVGIIGSVGAYTVKTAAASNAGSGCMAELFSNVRAKLAGCPNPAASGPTAPFASAAKTSAIAVYFRESFKNVFASNTSFIDTFSHLLGGLPNWAILLVYSAASIPFFLVLWMYNWLTNLFFALYNIKLLFLQKDSCEQSLFSRNKGCDKSAWQNTKDISLLSFRWIPVFFYLCFLGLTTFFGAIYTTFASLFSPLTLKFILNTNPKYGFADFLQDMVVTNKPLWFILFSLILLTSANTYLGGTYTAAAAVAVLVAWFKIV